MTASASDLCLCGAKRALHPLRRFGRGPQVALCPNQRGVFAAAAPAADPPAPKAKSEDAAKGPDKA